MYGSIKYKRLSLLFLPNPLWDVLLLCHSPWAVWGRAESQDSACVAPQEPDDWAVPQPQWPLLPEPGQWHGHRQLQDGQWGSVHQPQLQPQLWDAEMVSTGILLPAGLLYPERERERTCSSVGVRSKNREGNRAVNNPYTVLTLLRRSRVVLASAGCFWDRIQVCWQIQHCWLSHAGTFPSQHCWFSHS